MDEHRTIRFQVAPILFVASLLWGAWFDQTKHAWLVGALNGTDGFKLIGLIAGGGVVIFAGGYIIGTLTYFLLRAFFRFRPRCWGKSRYHEVAMREDRFKQVWEKLRVRPQEPDRWQELFAGAAFDYDVIRKEHKGVHEWMFRRWNAFNIATTSILGLALSLVFGRLVLNIQLTPAWWISVAIFEVVLVVTMCWAWHDTMNMLDFMIRMPCKEEPLKGADGKVCQPDQT
jgi:hypothetical protein